MPCSSTLPARVLACVVLLAGACRRASTEPTDLPLADEPMPHAELEPPLEPEVAPPLRARAPGTIFVDEVERATENGPGWLLRQLGPEPHRSAGKFAGWTITARFPDDPELAAACDLRVGDIVLAVEGDALATPTAYSKLFDRARQLESLHVTRIRDGVREEVVYRIVPAPLPERAQARYHRPR